MQKGWHKAHRLAQCQSEQVLDGQAKLDSRIRKLRAASAFAAGRGKPSDALVQPDIQRAPRLQSCVVAGPVDRGSGAWNYSCIAPTGPRGLIYATTPKNRKAP